MAVRRGSERLRVGKVLRRREGKGETLSLSIRNLEEEN